MLSSLSLYEKEKYLLLKKFLLKKKKKIWIEDNQDITKIFISSFSKIFIPIF